MQTMLGPIIILILTPHVHGCNRNTGGESGDHDGGYCPCSGASAPSDIIVGSVVFSIGTVVVAVTVVATISI